MVLELLYQCSPLWVHNLEGLQSLMRMVEVAAPTQFRNAKWSKARNKMGLRFEEEEEHQRKKGCLRQWHLLELKASCHFPTLFTLLTLPLTASELVKASSKKPWLIKTGKWHGFYIPQKHSRERERGDTLVYANETQRKRELLSVGGEADDKSNGDGSGQETANISMSRETSNCSWGNFHSWEEEEDLVEESMTERRVVFVFFLENKRIIWSWMNRSIHLSYDGRWASKELWEVGRQKIFEC